MPMSKPKKGEKQQDFISRCMSEMKGEFPDNKQRQGVCFSQWKNKDKKDIGMDKEKRSFTLQELEIETRDGDTKRIKGYAAVFDQESSDLGMFKEIIRKGAFRKTIKEGDVRALFNHDPNYVLGRQKNNTLSLKEDRKGLAIAIDPPATIWANDLITSIDRGDIDQMSFGFRTIKDKWHMDENENNVRELLEVELFDVSPVTFPAYPQTSVSLRSVDVDKLQRVLLRAEKSILTDADKTYLIESIEHIRKIVPLEPLQAEHSTEIQAGRKRRLSRLREAELSNKIDDITQEILEAEYV